MAKSVLPEIFREEIKSLLKKGYTQDAVFKFVEKSTESFVNSAGQLKNALHSLNPLSLLTSPKIELIFRCIHP